MSSIAKIVQIIEMVVARQDNGVNFADVVALTGIPKATVHRFLKELTAEGLLTFSRETKRYRGSLRLAALGAGVMANFDLRDHVHP